MSNGIFKFVQINMKHLLYMPLSPVWGMSSMWVFSSYFVMIGVYVSTMFFIGAWVGF